MSGYLLLLHLKELPLEYFCPFQIFTENQPLMYHVCLLKILFKKNSQNFGYNIAEFRHSSFKFHGLRCLLLAC